MNLQASQTCARRFKVLNYCHKILCIFNYSAVGCSRQCRSILTEFYVSEGEAGGSGELLLLKFYFDTWWIIAAWIDWKVCANISARGDDNCIKFISALLGVAQPEMSLIYVIIHPCQRVLRWKPADLNKKLSYSVKWGKKKLHASHNFKVRCKMYFNKLRARERKTSSIW